MKNNYSKLSPVLINYSKATEDSMYLQHRCSQDEDATVLVRLSVDCFSTFCNEMTQVTFSLSVQRLQQGHALKWTCSCPSPPPRSCVVLPLCHLYISPAKDIQHTVVTLFNVKLSGAVIPKTSV